MDSLVLVGLIFVGLGAVTADGINVNVTETAGQGTVLWNFTNFYQNCSLKDTVPSTEEYFRLDTQLGVLVLAKALDLEVIGELFSGRDALIKVQLSCETENAATEEMIDITVHVFPVNEFRPNFLQAPYSVEIPEGIPKGTSIFYLRDKARDSDAMAYNQIVSFDVHPYLISALDGRRYFFVNNETGEINTTLEIDYETFERHNYVLNITATDDGGRVSYPTTLAVNITDVDDMPPEFRQHKSSCITNCTVRAYSHVIDIHHKGDLDNIKPYSVFARDGDLGIGARINYSIQYDTDDELVTNVFIDDITGVLEVLVPYDNFTNVTSGRMTDPFYITVTIVATEISSNKRSSNASFSLTVYHVLPTPVPSRSPTQTTIGSVAITTGEGTDEDDGTSALLLVEILVPCCISVAFLLAVIIFALVKRQKRKEMKYQIKEKEDTRRQGDMMESLPATMASPYDLVGAYAHIDLGTYDNKGTSDGVDEEVDPSQYNGLIPADGMYSKVRKKASRPLKMRAVDIVEADLGDGEEGGTYDDVEKDADNTEDAKETVVQYEIDDIESEGGQKGFYNVADAGAWNGDLEIDVEATKDDPGCGNDGGYVNYNADECESIPENTSTSVAENDWPELQNVVNTQNRNYVDSD